MNEQPTPNDPTRYQPGMCTGCEERPAVFFDTNEHNGPFALCDECHEQTNALPLCGFCGTFGHTADDCDERELTDWSDEAVTRMGGAA